MKIERYQSEPYLSFVERATQAVSDGNMDYLSWSNAVLGRDMYGEENSRRNWQFFKQFIENLDKEEMKELNGDRRYQELVRQKDEIQKERKKLQVENSRLQDTYRYQARNELFNERIIEAIRQLEPIEDKMTKFRISYKGKSESTGLLLISDIHAGSNFEIRGLYDEIVSKYDEDIMKARMNHLAEKVIDDFDNLDYDKLVIGCLGDVVENVLRMSSLTKLKEPVVDTVIKFSEFYANWIAGIYNELGVPIEVVTIGGNHDVNRILGQKPEFENENMLKLVVEFLKLRLQNFENIKIRDYSDFDVMNICGVSTAFTHGTDSDLANMMNYFSNLYDVDLSILYAGHLHEQSIKNAGITDVGDRECIRIGSICGCDPYAKSIRKASRPSAYFAVFENGEGKTWERKYIL